MPIAMIGIRSCNSRDVKLMINVGMNNSYYSKLLIASDRLMHYFLYMKSVIVTEMKDSNDVKGLIGIRW